MTSPDTPRSPARRRLLAALAVLGVAGAGWLGLRPYDRKDWIVATVRRHLPGITLDAASLQRFAEELMRHWRFQDTRQRIALWMDHALPGIARRLPKAGDRIERAERMVVSEFLTGSNFFRVADPRREVIFYAGAMPACGNPFARFRDA
ncbi:MAG TPA: hypothetical protein PKE27_14295 [Povalibacter sp.]|uniref:hypothetical protein n=1 Tax=Povalibacter sp. TaxID=1962978 RepID=UPI002C016F1B|nr:hypothetical protein [Povalibacter sp.]HMN45744.1 hypothetical protein [Povalibacter sp.]